MPRRNRQAQIQIRASMLRLKQFSIEELQLESEVSRSAVQRFVHQALEQNCLELVHERHNGKAGGAIYRLVQLPTVPNAHIKPNSSRRKAWIAMRILRLFSLSDLQISVEISEENVKKYVRYLLEAGYLRVTRKRLNGSTDCNTYQLIRNSGPLAPVPRRDKTVFDPNSKEIFERSREI